MTITSSMSFFKQLRFVFKKICIWIWILATFTDKSNISSNIDIESWYRDIISPQEILQYTDILVISPTPTNQICCTGKNTFHGCKAIYWEILRYLHWALRLLDAQLCLVKFLLCSTLFCTPQPIFEQVSLKLLFLSTFCDTALVQLH